MVKTWSKSEIGVTVESVDPNANTMKLSNGKDITYKSLVLAPGLDTHES